MAARRRSSEAVRSFDVDASIVFADIDESKLMRSLPECLAAAPAATVTAKWRLLCASSPIRSQAFARQYGSQRLGGMASCVVEEQGGRPASRVSCRGSAEARGSLDQAARIAAHCDAARGVQMAIQHTYVY